MRPRDDEKERRIRRAVVEMALREGFGGTSIAKIARAASVSPATVYIYYENKDRMMEDIYLEESDALYRLLRGSIRPGMTGAESLSALMRSYYRYLTEEPESASFIEQYAGAPCASKCQERKGICQMYGIIRAMKTGGLLPDYSDANLAALILYPIKAIACDRHLSEEGKAERFEELVYMVNRLLLKQ
ncbi:TetR/AcrR family transcriptional regulator [Selenomonas sp. TAMA-11512]|uniref:TetR/AcrR family transcriptional regulator n=1 Tax=Selenomonas sp. TAMA-11512 TaxID=3095337 RepID=UPI0030879972|nr:TetR/AcrR family transcriptional regulator [Selenomonas sp. TAMA-11512]